MNRKLAEKLALKKYPLSQDEDVSATNMRLRYYYHLVGKTKGNFTVEEVKVLQELCQN